MATIEDRAQRGESEPKRVGTYLMLVAATTGWGVAGPMVKFSLEDVAPFTLAATRFGLGSFLLVLVLWWRGEARHLPRLADLPLLLGLGVLGVTAFGALYTAGLQWTGAAEGGLIQGSAPLVTMLLAAVVLGERVTITRLAGAGIAFSGLAGLIVGGPGTWGTGTTRVLGDALMLGSAISWGSYAVFVRLARGRFSMIQTSAYSVFVGAILLVPLALLETPRMPLAEVRPLSWAAIGYQIVVSSCLCYLWWNEGIRRIGAGRAATFGYVTPVATAVAAWLLLGERLAPLQLVGGAMVLGGLFIANRRVASGE